jgi:hypothetical protein
VEAAEKLGNRGSCRCRTSSGLHHWHDPPAFVVGGVTEPGRAIGRQLTATEIEEWAFGLLQSYLFENGHVVANVRRPDRVNRTSRDVDFLVSIDGHDIAIEITQLTQAREWWNLLDRLETLVRAGLSEFESETRADWLMLSINLLRTGSYREIETAAGQIVQAVRNAPADLGARSWDRITSLQEPAGSLAEVDLRRPSAAGRRLSFVKGHEAHDALIAPRALAFVRHLIASKGNQGEGYAEVWILVVDRELIIDLDNLRDAFSQERETVPANWTRLYFIPAIDQNAIQSLELIYRNASGRDG